MGFDSRCYALLQAIITCNFNENEWTKLEKMEKKTPSFRTDFGAQFFFRGFYLYVMLDIFKASDHCMPFQGKLMNQNTSFEAEFGLNVGYQFFIF